MTGKWRRVLFWMHLLTGISAAIPVVVLAATGTALSFQKEIESWAERRGMNDVREDAATPSDAAKADHVLARVRAIRPEQAVSSLEFRADRHLVRVELVSGEGMLVDPRTGEVHPPGGQRVRDAMAALLRWHRFLGASDQGKALGRSFTGAANALFFFLALSGIVLWWPRRWSQRAVRVSVWFQRGLRSRARDWNWHNVVGFWSLPALLVITFAGLVISYRPVSNLIYRAAGETPPARGPRPTMGPGNRSPAKPVATPLAPLIVHAQERIPDWTRMRLRLGPSARSSSIGAPGVRIEVKAPSAGPPFATVALSYDPLTGRPLAEERFSNRSPGRRLRTWLRYLHTGEALGWPGQLAAALACLGTLVLAYTGMALAWRRFFRRRSAHPPGLEPPTAR